MDTVELPAWLQGIAAIAATAGTTWWLTLKERKERKATPAPLDAQAQVVAATFTERGQMERLTLAMNDSTRAVLTNTAEVTELVTLLRADAQRRHDEAVIREALRKRGIME